MPRGHEGNTGRAQFGVELLPVLRIRQGVQVDDAFRVLLGEFLQLGFSVNRGRRGNDPSRLEIDAAQHQPWLVCTNLEAYPSCTPRGEP